MQLFFVGDPAPKPVEPSDPGVTLRRWSQWLSRQHPRNAYDGEPAKVHDWEISLPPWIVDEMLVPAQAAGERVLVICEEWQTANVAIAIDRLARERGVRGALTLMWNANNTYGFERIHWPTLDPRRRGHRGQQVHEVRAGGVGRARAGHPQRHRRSAARRRRPRADRGASRRPSAAGRPASKSAASTPTRTGCRRSTRWPSCAPAAIDARLIVRGGKEPYGDVVLGRAREKGLTVERLAYEGSDWREFAQRLAVAEAPVVHLRAFLDEATLYALYAAADAVLANSGKEPFGLVGLEVMAAGGIAVCGATGEEYAEPFVNAIVCDTADGRELAAYLRALFERPGAGRRAARATAPRRPRATPGTRRWPRSTARSPTSTRS